MPEIASKQKGAFFLSNMIKEGSNHHKKIRKGVTIQKIDGVATRIPLEKTIR